MADTNTIANLDNITALPYNAVFAIDDLNDLDIFGAPITKNVSALQLSNYINRSFGAATFIANCDLAQITNLTATYNNGTAGVGATLTNAGAQAALSIDGTTVVVGYRILIGGQTAALQNGIYTVTTVGTASTNWVLTRAIDYDEAAEILLGTFTSIQRGLSLIGRSYIQANTSITVGTTSILFQSLQSTLMSTLASLAIGGTGGNFFLGAGGGVFTLPTGTKTIATTQGGTAGMPAAGLIGETLQGSLASGSAVSLSTAVNTDIVSVAYTAGNYMVTAQTKFTYTTITNTVTIMFVGTATGDNQTGVTAYNVNHIEHPPTATSGTAGGTVTFPFYATGSGTLYSKIVSTFSVGSATAFGTLAMTRIA